jgi:hypothetical protein
VQPLVQLLVQLGSQHPPRRQGNSRFRRSRRLGRVQHGSQAIGSQQTGSQATGSQHCGAQNMRLKTRSISGRRPHGSQAIGSQQAGSQQTVGQQRFISN